ncbi:MAG TPA: protein-glutamate methylesterase/protein-glutamine glutaminase [Candidatus Wunengus sp. YC60]|uniref:protein-glutamate methylesterase/protein-glutamine glutaminase n=1 Tax=Candidatus Wunengus sp. YC60 TaxID=3367697 RepID=UPI0040263BA9
MNLSAICNPKSEIIKVLVVDDSSFMRKSLTYILESDSSIKVVGVAEDGLEALKKVRELHPGVVLLDIEMPRMDGFTALRHIMNECPTPVLVISALNKRDPTITIKSLEYGAIDFIAKPSGVISYDIEKIRDEIIDKVKTAASVDIQKLRLNPPEESFEKQWSQRAQKEIVVIGASTGGPRAVVTVLSCLPRNIPTAILVVQHMIPEFVPSLADRLKWGCALEVGVAQEGDVLDQGRVLVAPGIHTAVVKEGEQKRISLKKELSHDFNSYAINHAMESAANAYDSGVLGVLLTGMGSDGANGMKAIKDAGGGTIAEDQSTCIVFGMPRAAIEMGCVDKVVPLPKIGQAIMEMI